MTIKEYFKDKQILTYTDVMDYANDTLLYSLREISADQVWDIEAVYHHKTDGPAYDITFRKEFLSPYKNYNQVQAQTLIDDLNDSFINLLHYVK